MTGAFRIFCAAFTGLFLVPAISLAGAQFNLVENSQLSATIVIAAQPSENARVAAAKFQSYMEKMSGAKLPIVTDDQSPHGSLVLIGPGKLTQAIPGLIIPTGRTKNLREEGFAIFAEATFWFSFLGFGISASPLNLLNL